MNEMLNYVFNSMKTSERALAKLEKTLRKQARSNRRLKLIAITGVAYAIWAESVRREHLRDDCGVQVLYCPEADVREV